MFVFDVLPAPCAKPRVPHRLRLRRLLLVCRAPTSIRCWLCLANGNNVIILSLLVNH